MQRKMLEKYSSQIILFFSMYLIKICYLVIVFFLVFLFFLLIVLLNSFFVVLRLQDFGELLLQCRLIKLMISVIIDGKINMLIIWLLNRQLVLNSVMFVVFVLLRLWEIFQKLRKVLCLCLGVYLVMVEQLYELLVFWKKLFSVQKVIIRNRLVEFVFMLVLKFSIQMVERISINGRNCLVFLLLV